MTERLQPVEPRLQIGRPDIVAQCPGAYLSQSREQYTLIVETPFTSKHWSRRTVNFEMALERANKVLDSIAEEALRRTNPLQIMCCECWNVCVLSRDGKRWLCQYGHSNERIEDGIGG